MMTCAAFTLRDPYAIAMPASLLVVYCVQGTTAIDLS